MAIKKLASKLRMVSIVAFLLIVFGSSAFCEDCTKVIPSRVGNIDNAVKIDNTWTGAAVGFDAVERNRLIYIGYYDSLRRLSIAQYSLDSFKLCVTHLGSTFGGWDGHNNIVMAFDTRGRLHIAGNMHDSRLVYGRSFKANSISDVEMQGMVGVDEDSVTYPNFAVTPDGSLSFLYRNGTSGDGGWYVNVFNGLEWRRAVDGKIFAATSRGRTTSAYPSPFVIGPDGFANISIVWRRKLDVKTNYAISFVKTRDFIHWFDHNGNALKLPIGPEDDDVIENTGEERGLLNSQRVGASADGQPIVAYTRYGSDGKNAIILARPNGKIWKKSIIASSKRVATIRGGGSLPQAPRFQVPSSLGSGIGKIQISFPDEPAKVIYFDETTLSPVATPDLGRQKHDKGILISSPNNLVDGRKIEIEVRSYSTEQPVGSSGRIVYFAQRADRDRPRSCTTSEPTACNPPSTPLVFIPNLSHQ
ncbi:BNR repeat-containing protein [Agrobacterium tumefaciens]|uniref:Uncharacterized protein n=1 Tax=Agrobacterium tumefaciens TaxID=358 RepID=A0AA44J8B5_AGRTU|nr:BNR repeat-containing protein [Agrobacterium tumefaciens]NSL24029.1 hypothetical protein [Agrobacterium tumefaciens]NTB87992.1 hypothetical protein [Agrobacterium tumefaciens]NTC16244.1 hypothetical protein [Agrobacterium tumefaciens]NTC27808.1 hypothetical protein [Agrobacterium tumefaciens]NTC55638.1 hypothetical protein [Agrobacterium tumefaciens]